MGTRYCRLRASGENKLFEGMTG